MLSLTKKKMKWWTSLISEQFIDGSEIHIKKFKKKKTLMVNFCIGFDFLIFFFLVRWQTKKKCFRSKMDVPIHVDVAVSWQWSVLELLITFIDLIDEVEQQDRQFAAGGGHKGAQLPHSLARPLLLMQEPLQLSPPECTWRAWLRHQCT